MSVYIRGAVRREATDAGAAVAGDLGVDGACLRRTSESRGVGWDELLAQVIAEGAWS